MILGKFENFYSNPLKKETKVNGVHAANGEFVHRFDVYSRCQEALRSH
jgi:hypothetical protein